MRRILEPHLEQEVVHLRLRGRLERHAGCVGLVDAHLDVLRVDGFVAMRGDEVDVD